jgi:hypothetical protein
MIKVDQKTGEKHIMSDRRSRPAAQTAAALSPFPAIADYAFLLDCHTGALVAPDGPGARNHRDRHSLVVTI